MAHSYGSLTDAAAGLLCESVDITARLGIPFVVVGGWSPLLLNGGGAIRHPGTRDVDLLFRDGGEPGTLRRVFEELRQAGYRPSAKHEFQLLRVLRVEDEDFLFNVDLLHAREGRDSPELFADHMSLPIRLTDFSEEQFIAKSIVLPVSRFLFEQAGHVVQSELRADLPDGSAVTARIPLMDEAGTLVTKARSMESPKRPRDGFDIMLAVVQARNRAELVQKLFALKGRHNEAFAELPRLYNLLREPEHRKRIARYWSGANDDRAWQTVSSTIHEILQSAGVQESRKS